MTNTTKPDALAALRAAIETTPMIELWADEVEYLINCQGLATLTDAESYALLANWAKLRRATPEILDLGGTSAKEVLDWYAQMSTHSMPRLLAAAIRHGVDATWHDRCDELWDSFEEETSSIERAAMARELLTEFDSAVLLATLWGEWHSASCPLATAVADAASIVAANLGIFIDAAAWIITLDATMRPMCHAPRDAVDVYVRDTQPLIRELIAEATWVASGAFMGA